MTEKRFMRKDYAIYEEGNPICMTLRDVDVRLNELWEENERLKSELKALRKKYNDFSDAVDKRLQEMDKRLLE